MTTYSIQNELKSHESYPLDDIKHKKHIEENKGIYCPTTEGLFRLISEEQINFHRGAGILKG